MNIITRLPAKPNPKLFNGNLYIEIYSFASWHYARLVDDMGFVHKDNIGYNHTSNTYQDALKFAYKYQL